MTPPVPRIGRVLDAAGLFLFLLGAGVYGWAWTGLRRLQEVQPSSAGRQFAAVARANDLTILSRVGVALLAGGALVAVAAAVVARLRRDDEQ